MNVLIEQQRTMNHQQLREASHSLALADGNYWEITADNDEVASIVSQLACSMRLNRVAGAIKPSHHDNVCQLFVQIQGDMSALATNYYVPAESGNNRRVVCNLMPYDYWGAPNVNLSRLSLVFAREAQAGGGVLMHGALAEWNGMGVIMTAPSGTGKTTASNRLPPPWRSLSDDTTLVVRDSSGNYFGHPWPTWSRFVEGGPGGEWDVQKAVPLRGIFFLSRSVEDRTERLGTGHAVSLLLECVKHVSLYMAPGLRREKIMALYREQFNNLCDLTRVIPVHMLHISLGGVFWQAIEKTLEEVRGEETIN